MARFHPDHERDRGQALVLGLVLIVVCALLIVPLLGYATSVGHASRTTQAKVTRVEAVRAGLRMALNDAKGTYATCKDAGLTAGKQLPAPPGLSVGVQTTCYKIGQAAAEDPSSLRYAVAAVRVGATVPSGVTGTPFPGSGAAPESAWVAASTPTPTVNKVWLPQLPSHALNQRSPIGYSMPVSGATPCTVYFPGTYVDPVVIKGPGSVYFTSGIYYFENTVRFSGNADVVIGAGRVPGCTTDQEAAFYAVDAPTTHNINGLGATFILGAGGRFVVDTADAGTALKVVFNARAVVPGDAGAAPSAGVSIMTVDGVAPTTTGGDNTDLAQPGTLFVPRSTVGGSSTPGSAAVQGYNPSTVLAQPVLPPATPAPAVVQVDLASTAAVQLIVPGYVAVPQGAVRVTTGATGAANKDVRFAGGVLAATIDVVGPRSATFTIGITDPIVQESLKIVTETTSGTPRLVSTAIVQINENGSKAVNSWFVV